MNKELSKVDYLEEISNYIFLSKYSRYNEKLARRETWNEAVSRVENMHLKKYSFLSEKDKEQISWAFSLVKDKRVVPSMRSLQFGGKAIEAKNERIYNCAVRHIDSLRSFSEVFYLLLCGCGVGLGLSNYFLNRLPDLVDNKDKTGTIITYVCLDSIEGWADSIEALLMCYFKNTPFTGRKIVFDYCVDPDTLILKSDLSWSKAKDININDELVSFDEENPKKSANNRRYLKRGKVIKNSRIIRPCYRITTDRGEVICSQEHRWLTKGYYKKGYKHFDWEQTSNLNIGDEIAFSTTPWEIDGSFDGGYMSGLFDGEGWVSTTTCGIAQNQGEVSSFIEEKLLSKGILFSKDEKEQSNSKTLISYRSKNKWEAMKILGSFRPKRLMKKSNLLWEKNSHATGKGHIPAKITKIEFIGDREVIAIETDAATFIANGFLSHNSKIRPEGTPLKTGGGKAPGYKGLKYCHLKVKQLLDHIIEYKQQSRLKTVDAYDIIMHTADSVLSGGVRRSSTSVIFDKNDIDMVNAKAKFKVDKVFSFNCIGEETVGGFTNKVYEGKVNFEGNRYEITVKEYELEDLQKKNLVSWVHLFPQRARSNNSVLLLRDSTTEKEFAEIIERTKQFGEPGFVWGNHPHQLFNPCFEIGFIPVTKDGICGVQFCNLTSQNGRKITNKEEFTESVIAATIIGTLQAGHTDFPYLSKAAKDLTEEEALLGVSITGVMDNPDILLNPKIQKEMAELSISINKEWSKKIGVNQAARITCIKPEGTSSLVLGTGSGIHPHHARKYFRRVMANKIENIYKHFKKTNPKLSEHSVWSATKTDDVITFPIEISEKAIIKADLNALKHLDLIKSTQQNWVLSGTTLNNKKPIEHNVSCTIIVKDNEWNDIISYIYKNRSFFAAISFIPDGSDKIYAQAPMEAIVDSKDEENWNNIISNFNHIDYKILKETDDYTALNQELSCFGGACSII